MVNWWPVDRESLHVEPRSFSASLSCHSLSMSFVYALAFSFVRIHGCDFPLVRRSGRFFRQRMIEIPMKMERASRKELIYDRQDWHWEIMDDFFSKRKREEPKWPLLRMFSSEIIYSQTNWKVQPSRMRDIHEEISNRISQLAELESTQVGQWRLHGQHIQKFSDQRCCPGSPSSQTLLQKAFVSFAWLCMFVPSWNWSVPDSRNGFIAFFSTLSRFILHAVASKRFPPSLSDEISIPDRSSQMCLTSMLFSCHLWHFNPDISVSVHLFTTMPFWCLISICPIICMSLISCIEAKVACLWANIFRIRMIFDSRGTICSFTIQSLWFVMFFRWVTIVWNIQARNLRMLRPFPFSLRIWSLPSIDGFIQLKHKKTTGL
jgi:hypothetical protein